VEDELVMVAVLEEEGVEPPVEELEVGVEPPEEELMPLGLPSSLELLESSVQASPVQPDGGVSAPIPEHPKSTIPAEASKKTAKITILCVFIIQSPI
jgi:hypothetical protein